MGLWKYVGRKVLVMTSSALDIFFGQFQSLFCKFFLLFLISNSFFFQKLLFSTSHVQCIHGSTSWLVWMEYRWETDQSFKLISVNVQVHYHKSFWQVIESLPSFFHISIIKHIGLHQATWVLQHKISLFSVLTFRSELWFVSFYLFSYS